MNDDYEESDSEREYASIGGNIIFGAAILVVVAGCTIAGLWYWLS